MKKAFFTVCLILLVSMSVFAYHDEMKPTYDSGYFLSSLPYRHTSAKTESMGGAGITALVPQDALYINPASLAVKEWAWNLPQTSITVYNIRDILATGIANDSNIDKNIGKYAPDLMKIYGKGGYNSIARMDVGAGVKIQSFALALDTQLRLDTYTPKGDSTAVSLVPSADIVISAGLGFRMFEDSPVSVDIGGAFRVDSRLYYEKLELKKFLTGGDIKFEEVFMKSTPVVSALAFPVDLGMNVNIPGGFHAGCVVRNINGNFKSVTYFENMMEAKNNESMGKSTDFEIKTPVSIDAGISWVPDFGNFEYLIKPTVAADIVDITGLMKDYSNENLLRHLRLGAELKVLTLFELRGGLNGGYITLGAGFNFLNVFHMEVSYYRADFGLKPGDSNTDALTLRMNLIWEH